jgi:hypothetical protein
MAKLSKLLSLGIQLQIPIEIFRKDTDEEFYHDLRTVHSFKEHPRVKKIAENDLFFWYVCPNCTQIHIESKRNLNVANKAIWSNCKRRIKINQYIIIDTDIKPIAHQEVDDDVLEQEWNFMQNFES